MHDGGERVYEYGRVMGVHHENKQLYVVCIGLFARYCRDVSGDVSEVITGDWVGLAPPDEQTDNRIARIVRVYR